jgi:hypothetical protein
MGVAEGTPVFLLTAKVFGAKELRTKTFLLLLDQRTTGFARAFSIGLSSRVMVPRCRAAEHVH